MNATSAATAPGFIIAASRPEIGGQAARDLGESSPRKYNKNNETHGENSPRLDEGGLA
jgi:hypothetical protein